MVNSIGFSLLSASYAFSLCTLHFHFHFVLGFSIPGKLPVKVAIFGRGPILSAPTHSASQSGHFWTRSNSERSHFNLEMMMYACVRQLHGAYGATSVVSLKPQLPNMVLGHATCNREMGERHLYTYKRRLDPPVPVLAEQRERESAADRWYAEAVRRKSEHKRKFDETGVDDIECSTVSVWNEGFGRLHSQKLNK